MASFKNRTIWRTLGVSVRLLRIKVKGEVLLYRFSVRVMDFSCHSVSRNTGVCGMGIKLAISPMNM